MNKQERQERYAAKRKRQNEVAAGATADSSIPQVDSRLDEIVQLYPTQVHWVSLDDIQRIQTQSAATLSPMDKLILPYLDLRDSDSGKNGKRAQSEQHLFIAEGTETVRVLLQQTTRNDPSSPSDESVNVWPPIVLQSILIKPQLLIDPPVRLWDTIQSTMDTSSQTSIEASTSSLPAYILVATESVLCALTGFATSRGCLACGMVPTPHMEEAWLERYLQRWTGDSNDSSTVTNGAANRHVPSQAPLRILALDGIADTANMGSLIRTAAALHVQLILLSDDCCSPWYRKSVRVSMGHVGTIPLCRVSQLSVTIGTLLRSHVISSYAAVIDPQAQYRLSDLKTVPCRWCCVVGSEANGISSAVIQACDATVRIDMAMGVDSLSVPIATGILLHGLREREETTSSPRTLSTKRDL